MKRALAWSFSLGCSTLVVTACGGSGDKPAQGDGPGTTGGAAPLGSGGQASSGGASLSVGGGTVAAGGKVGTGASGGTAGAGGGTGGNVGIGGALTSGGGSGGGTTEACTATCAPSCGPSEGTAQPGQCDEGKVCCTLASGPGDIVYDYGAAVEDTGADCVLGTLPEASAIAKNSKLPNPFLGLDGKPITKKSDFRCRRKEIRAQAEKYVYGERPAPPKIVTGTVDTKQVTVHVEEMGKSIDFTAKITLPSTATSAPPYAAVIYVGSGGIPTSNFLNEGVAVINFNNGEIGTEHQPEGNLKQGDVRSQPRKGKFYDIYGGLHTAGLLQAWSWGASRLIDVLQKTDQSVIAWQRLGVTGCSRLGKGAFAVGLFDERIALTIPHETSTGGVPAYRIADAIPTEKTDGNYWGQLWFSNNFEPFVLNTTQLPMDTHAFIAAIAPRGIMILENPHVAQMGAPAGHMAVLAASKVWDALGVLDRLSYFSDIPNSSHCQYSEAYTPLLKQNIKRFLKHENEDPGRIEAGKEVKPEDWIDWTPPTLTDE
jgi:hypothetical protein